MYCAAMAQFSIARLQRMPRTQQWVALALATRNQPAHPQHGKACDQCKQCHQITRLQCIDAEWFEQVTLALGIEAELLAGFSESEHAQLLALLARLEACARS